MAKETLSKATFETLVKHLVEIEGGKNKLLEQYFPEPSKERNEFASFLDEYIERVDQLIKNASKSKNTGNRVPFVISGSEVEVQDLSDQKVFKYRIVIPIHGSVRGGDVSYLSPMGKSLMLRRVGDEVEVKAPGGVFRYQITSIQLQRDTM